MHSNATGVFTKFGDLSEIERQLVSGTWEAAKRAYIPRSNFPVGSTVLAANSVGHQRIFSGCNVEGRFFPQTICAERNAITTAVMEGYTKVLAVALVCAKYQGPGASPCGVCRQVLMEFNCDAVMMNMADEHSNVYRFKLADLLPAAKGERVAIGKLPDSEQHLVAQLNGLLPSAYVPYSKAPQAAVVSATDASGVTREFSGVSDDNSSYGASALAACVALRAARTAGFTRKVTLAQTVDDPSGHNPVEGECLQVLREFGLTPQVVLLGPDGTAVRATLDELLPDSFGPESLV